MAAAARVVAVVVVVGEGGGGGGGEEVWSFRLGNNQCSLKRFSGLICRIISEKSVIKNPNLIIRNRNTTSLEA